MVVLAREDGEGSLVGSGRVRLGWVGESLVLSVFTSLSRFEYVNRARCIVTANA